ncbi:LysR family transcriptional regulator [Bradyrhizobium sp. U87765 SZCCT0131]|uniref:LysR substrate-binding domain-containing protein n=1 Tax=unclassified Bradyrhizobium TaxID=2631580 RepID=UPI001BA784F6|nr:LysR family transcriptional regulator [Bradyrhizobium sp. U87765 SZCCT0131]MBR1259027.1 LysR family transcriptional regulator [Bradyrhizobium sp. U87765 SZCCT0134]MBR1305168.1 LysR family transcriptional regulator [Bradyrhizobium sp. U87765 SZCCT0110]MBR1320954.1 LysR family transcriptional regulator [Bradyrhizobium sp. U87765 SZCCT0109]MBR1350392.1 LysR family transcriptional regulator [Bradyrhizobium sp. U87765 SZCCT0048]
MALTHRQLEAFQVFMEMGTVTAAADRLRVSQPAMSKILAALEYDLKLKLFKRVRKRLMPTNEAHLLYVEVRRLMTSISDITEFARDLAHLRSGELRIAAAASIGHTLLADAIAAFAREHDKTRINLNVSTSISQLVTSQKVDLGFTLLQIQHPALVTEPLFHARAVCIVPADHRLAGRAAISVDDLEGEQVISFMRESRMRHLIDAKFEERGVSRLTQYEVFTSVEASGLVARGLGVSIVEPLGVLYRSDPSIAICRFEPAIEFTFFAMRPRHLETTRLATAFMEELDRHIQALCRKRDDWLKIRLPGKSRPHSQ